MGNTYTTITNTASTASMLVRYKWSHNTDEKPSINYKCKCHDETIADKIQISPTYHTLIIDGYIREQCCSSYILPRDVSMLCKTMLWGSSYHVITINERDASLITSPKQTATDHHTNNPNDINTRRDSKKYDMKTLYHHMKGEILIYGIPFTYKLESDGMHYITFTIDTYFKSRIMAQISLYCSETNDLVRFWNTGVLRISVDKCKQFRCLHFICKANVYEMHQVVSARTCKTFYNNDIQIAVNSECKYKLNEHILSLKMSKQQMNRYYLKPFGIFNNWALSICHRDTSNLIQVQLEALKIPYGFCIDACIQCEVVSVTGYTQIKEDFVSFMIPTKICQHIKGKLEHKMIFKDKNGSICVSQTVVSVYVTVMNVININQTIPKPEWHSYGIK